jgi:hypothetical protein
MKPAIAHTRASTAQQGKSGLGLEAQQAALVRFAEAEGYNSSRRSKRSKPARVLMRSIIGPNCPRP